MSPVARTTTDSTRGAEALRLHDSVVGLREAVQTEAAATLNRWRPLIERDEFMQSAANLAHYIALRHHDLRDLQLELMPLGLSSLGRCEARVMPTLDAVIAVLADLAGEDDDHEGADAPEPEAFFAGHALLSRQSDAALGPAPQGRAVRIMVTLPSEAAADSELVRELLGAGMDIARINCGHDDPAAWNDMVAQVRRVAAEMSRSCRICFDLSGPRSRVDATTVPEDARLKRGDRVLMLSTTPPVPSEWAQQFQCSIPEVFESLRDGDPVWINDGKLGLTVERTLAEGVLLQVTQAREKGEHLRRNRALNFPETELHIEPLTDRDLRDLDAIVPLADVVGYSFVQRREDIVRLEEELARRGASPAMALIAKIETAAAVQNLPELIVQGAGARPLAIMIARGDLMVELGHRRMAEMQEELLWLCEAAHVPVIWATQVLDNLVKKGVRNRAELTDAAMAERAECVMLNKGPYAAEAVRLLADVLGRMEGHQFKKASRMRALHSW